MRIVFLAAAALLYTACTHSPAPPVAPAASNIQSSPDTSHAAHAAPITEPTKVADIQQVNPSVAPQKTAPAKLQKVVPEQAQPVMPIATPATPTAPLPLPPDHQPWSELLQRHVDVAGKVDYKGFKSEAASLNAYCDSLAAHPPAENWTRQEVLAYWLNAYNAFTIKLIVDNYPIKSILRLDGGKTWDVRRIRLGDKRYSLNQIENEIIRPQFQEPRIHFALNCAARSCPPLYNRAFEANQLETQLQIRTRLFLNNKNYNSVTSDNLRLSKIFDWYSKDFGSITSFIQPFVDISINPKASISFNEYDWDLND